MNDGGYLLLVEDDPSLQAGNKRMLERRGYNLRQAYNLAEARAIIKEEPPRAIVLDIGLPDGSGLDLLREIRQTANTPVLMLTAMDTSNDIIRGFQTGCDDYLTKPYDFVVFQSRIDALLRRAATVPETIEYEAFTLYPLSARALLDGEDMLLPQKEYVVLQLLVQNPGKILSAEYLYEKAWGYEMTEHDKSLKVAISKLRSKMSGSMYTITASRGEGYYIERL